MKWRIAGIVGLSLIYATLRYNVFKGVAWDEWPTYVVNKAAALAALVLIVMAVALRSREGSRNRLLAVAGWLVLLHVGLSLALLGPASYEGCYREGKLTLAAGLSVLIGAASAATFPRLMRSVPDDALSSWYRRSGWLAFACGLHAALLGYGNWANPSAWPGFMVPITMIAFLSGLVGLAAAFRKGTTSAPRIP